MRVKEFTKTHSKKVLDYIGKTLHLDIYYFMRGGFWLTLSHAVYVLTALLLVMAFTRFTSKEFYGSYQFIVAFVSTMAIFSLPGMNDAITQAVATGREKALIQGTLARLRWSLIGTLLLFLAAGYFKIILLKNFWWIFALLGIFFPLFQSFEGYTAYFLGKKQFAALANRDIAIKLTGTVITLFVLYYTQSLFLIALCTFLIPGAMSLFFYFRIIRSGLKSTSQDIVHYGWHLTAMESFITIATYADKFILSYFLGLESLAVYTVATALPEGLKGLMKFGVPLTLPKLSEMKGNHIYPSIKSKVRLLFLLSVIAAAIGILASPFIVPLLFSRAYSDSSFYAQILFISLIFGLPATVLQTLLQAKKQIKALYYTNASYAIIQILALLVLTPIYGIVGVCLSRIIARFTLAMHLWFFARKT